MIKVVFTCGDINGVAPEIAVKVFSRIITQQNKNHIIYISPVNVFRYYYKKNKTDFKINIIDSVNHSQADYLNIIPLRDVDLSIGKVTAKSGRTSYNSLRKAIEIINKKEADILVTSPLSKEAINKSGIKFIGHTELLAESEKTNDYLMTFVSNDLIAALATIHVPLKKVSELLSKRKIKKIVSLFNKSLEQDFKIQNSKIAILGLNPHAGENGLIGKEESEILIPAIKSLNKNYNLFGPFVPDAFWGNHLYKNYDAVLGMYHDQVLIPFKVLNFSSGVNYTAGLKMIRTSPDHGTAFDIAGKNIADPSSLFQAYKVGLMIYQNRKKYFAASKS